MGKLGILGKILILILAPALVIIGVMTGASFHFATQALKDQSKETMVQASARYANDLTGKIEEVQQAVITTAKIIESEGSTIDKTRGLLQATKASHPNIANIFLGVEANGELIDALGSPVNLVDSRQRPWFKAVKGDQAAYSEIYISKSVGAEVFTVSYPVKVNGERLGVIGAEIRKSQLSETASQIKYGDNGYAFLIDRSGKFIYHPSFTSADDIFSGQNGAFKETGKLFLNGVPHFIEAVSDGVDKFYASTPISDSGDVLVLVIPVAEFLGGVNRMAYIISWIGAAGIILLALVVFLVSRRMTRLLQQMLLYAEEIASGDLTGRQKILSSQDELGKLQSALEKMGDNLRTMISRVAGVAEQVAVSSEELTASSGQSAQAANQVATSTTDMASKAAEQLAETVKTFAVMEQMSTDIQQVAANTNHVAEQSAQAADKAEEGDRAVGKAVRQMVHIEETVNISAKVVNRLGERSKEIGQIVDTISGIAGQTNLLALNAAIEAARAGEQGRGFAVVAEEVRKLAEQSQEAAKKIAELIGEIQGDTDKAVIAMNDGTREVKTGAEVVNAAGAAFREIAELVTQVSGQVKEISAAIQQMASGSRQVASSVKKIDELSRASVGEVQSVSSATEEQLASMEEIAGSSEALSKLVQDLQTTVAKFHV